MILAAIKYKNKFFTEFKEISIKNGYGGHGVGIGEWLGFEPIFGEEPIYFTKRSVSDKIQLILNAMNENLIDIDCLKLVIKNG